MDNQYLMQSKRHPDGYMNRNDSLLDGFTLEQLIVSLHSGSKVIDEDEVKNVVREMLDGQIEDLNALVQENMDEIIQTAYEGREDSPYKRSAFDDAWSVKAEALAQDIVQMLRNAGMWQDVGIYYNGKCLSTFGEDENGKEIFRYNGEPFTKENVDPRDYFEYVRKPNILSMSFEGPFYEVLNHFLGSRIEASFNQLLASYGLYYELGGCWNLSVYEI